MRKSVLLLLISLMAVMLASAGSLELLSPNGGESYTAGKEVMIRWKAIGIKGTVTLELIKNGAYFGTIVKMPAGYGSYRWKAGSTINKKTATGNFHVKIITEDRRYTDMSDAGFNVKSIFSTKKATSMKPMSKIKTTPAVQLNRAYNLKQYRPPVKEARLSRTLNNRFEIMRPIVDAYKNAVKNPAAGRAAMTGIINQLKKNGPIGFVNGYWVAVVDMTRIYAIPEVGIAMRSSLTANENSRFNSLVSSNNSMNATANAFVIFIPAKEAAQLGLLEVNGFHNEIINDPQMGGFDSGFIDSMRDIAGLGALDNLGDSFGGGFGLGTAIESGAAILGAWIGSMIGGPIGTLIGAAVAQGIILLVDWIIDLFEEDEDEEGDAKPKPDGQDDDDNDEEDQSSTGIVDPWYREGWSSGYLVNASGLRSVISVNSQINNQDLMMGLAGAYMVTDTMIRSGEITAGIFRNNMNRNVLMAF